jgi:hypothetical protein
MCTRLTNRASAAGDRPPSAQHPPNLNASREGGVSDAGARPLQALVRRPVLGLSINEEPASFTEHSATGIRPKSQAPGAASAAPLSGNQPANHTDRFAVPRDDDVPGSDP